jgi:hypothetical protein
MLCCRFFQMTHTCGPFTGFHCEYTDEEGSFWRVWQLAKSQTELFVTYNTDAENADRQRELWTGC